MNIRLFLKTFLYSVSALCVVSFIIFTSIKETDTSKKIPDKNNASKNASQSIIVPENKSISHYLLKLENSVINIYEIYNNNTKMHKGTLDIPVETLREIDRQKFESGIILENASDILHIAEDFSS